jgi:alpha-glucosidase
MLVCPITREGDLGRLLYLPAGEWYNFWTSEVLDGKQEVFVEAPLDQIPVFIRAGAVLPQFPLMQYVGEISFDSMPLHVYYKKGKYISELYEDAGDFFGHDQGNYRMHTFETEGFGAKLEIRQAWEGRFNSEYASYELHVHGLPFIPAGMLLEGKPVMFDRDFSADQTVFKFTVDKKFESIVLMRLDGFADL